jgi:hypothetical protein
VIAGYATALTPECDNLSDKSDSLIRAAVKDCLARCYRGNTPLGELAEFLGDLRAQGWSPADIRKVESAVRKVLAGVVTEDTNQGEE